MGAVISFLVIAIVVLLILSSCIRIVPQAQALVVERLGAYLETWSVGVHFKVPFIDRVAKRVILKERLLKMRKKCRNISKKNMIWTIR